MRQSFDTDGNPDTVSECSAFIKLDVASPTIVVTVCPDVIASTNSAVSFPPLTARTFRSYLVDGVNKRNFWISHEILYHFVGGGQLAGHPMFDKLYYFLLFVFAKKSLLMLVLPQCF